MHMKQLVKGYEGMLHQQYVYIYIDIYHVGLMIHPFSDILWLGMVYAFETT